MKKKFIFGLLLFPLILSGCDNSTNSNDSTTSQTSSSENSQSSEMPTISVEEDFNYTEDFSYDIYNCLTTIVNNGNLAVGNKYEITFSFINADSTNPTITSSNTSVFNVYKKENSTTYVIDCLSAGDSILTIKDSTGLIHFRYVVHVRNKLTKESAAELLVSVDYWKNTAPFWSGGDFDMIFVDESTCYFNSYENGTLLAQYTLTYEYVATYDEFITYNVIEINPQTVDLKITSFDLDITGSEIRPFDNIGLFDIFVPVTK